MRCRFYSIEGLLALISIGQGITFLWPGNTFQSSGRLYGPLAAWGLPDGAWGTAVLVLGVVELFALWRRYRLVHYVYWFVLSAYWMFIAGMFTLSLRTWTGNLPFSPVLYGLLAFYALWGNLQRETA